MCGGLLNNCARVAPACSNRARSCTQRNPSNVPPLNGGGPPGTGIGQLKGFRHRCIDVLGAIPPGATRGGSRPSGGGLGRRRRVTSEHQIARRLRGTPTTRYLCIRGLRGVAMSEQDFGTTAASLAQHARKLANAGVRDFEVDGDTVEIRLADGVSMEISLDAQKAGDAGDATPDPEPEPEPEPAGGSGDPEPSESSGYKCSCGESFESHAALAGHTGGSSGEHEPAGGAGGSDSQDGKGANDRSAASTGDSAHAIIGTGREAAPSYLPKLDDSRLEQAVSESAYTPRSGDTLATQAAKALAHERDLGREAKIAFLKGVGFGNCPEDGCELAAAGYERDACAKHD